MTTRRKVLVAAGDGIGTEVTAAAVEVLRAVSQRFGLGLELEPALVGGASIAAHGTALTDAVLDRARAADAILFGAVGDPRYDGPDAPDRPERAILALRKQLGLFANLRPVRVDEASAGRSPLRESIVAGTDLLVVRELTGGIYFGQPRGREGARAFDTMVYTAPEIERIAHVAFGLAMRRRKRLTSVDKANVLDTSRLWREVVTRVAADYPEVELEHLLVDACAMDMLRRPTRFDVLVTGNMFGDILTDEASMLPGSMGLMPSASLAPARPDGTHPGLYEPIHGSAPDIAGQGIANPVATIASAAMLLRSSLGQPEAAAAVEAAIAATLAEGVATVDILGPSQGVSTQAVTEAIVARINPG